MKVNVFHKELFKIYKIYRVIKGKLELSFYLYSKFPPPLKLNTKQQNKNYVTWLLSEIKLSWRWYLKLIRIIFHWVEFNPLLESVLVPLDTSP